jgi:hypothetical protein
MCAILINLTLFLLLQFFCELGYGVEEISDEANICHLKDRGVCILVVAKKAN